MKTPYGALAVLLLSCQIAFAQSNPGYQEGQIICANTPNANCPDNIGLNQAFAGKQDLEMFLPH
jgi:hypothetical protein